MHRGGRPQSASRPRTYAACPACCRLSSAMLTSRTPRVTGGSQRSSTTRSRSSGRESFEHGRGTALHLAPDSRGAPLRSPAGRWRLPRRCGRSPCWRDPARARCGCPVPTDPDLFGAEQLRDVMVLHPGQVPHEPSHRVGSRLGSPAELLLCQALHGSGRQGRDPAVQLEQERRSIHGPHLMDERKASNALAPDGAVRSRRRPPSRFRIGAAECRTGRWPYTRRR